MCLANPKPNTNLGGEFKESSMELLSLVVMSDDDDVCFDCKGFGSSLLGSSIEVAFLDILGDLLGECRGDAFAFNLLFLSLKFEGCSSTAMLSTPG
jgi:hypothetical protein